MRDIGSHAPHLKAMGCPPPGRKPLGSRRSGRAGEPAAGESVGASESLDDVPQDPRLPSYPPNGPTDRPPDLYGSLSALLGISRSIAAPARLRPRLSSNAAALITSSPCPARKSSRKFSRLLDEVMANHAKRSLPIWVHTPFLAFVAGAGVVHRDPGGRLDPGAQDPARLGNKGILALDQQTHHLALGDIKAKIVELGNKARHRHLALVILGQHVAAAARARSDRRARASSIPLGASLGRPLSPLRRAISSRKAAFSTFRLATSSNSWSTNRLRPSRSRASISGGDPVIAASNHKTLRFGNPPNEINFARTFAPVTRRPAPGCAAPRFPPAAPRAASRPAAPRAGGRDRRERHFPGRIARNRRKRSSACPPRTT